MSVIADRFSTSEPLEYLNYRPKLLHIYDEKPIEIPNTSEYLTLSRPTQSNTMSDPDAGVTYLEASPEPILILTDEEIVFANEAAYDLVDLDGDASLRGRDVTEFIVPADREAVHESIQRVLAEGAETNRSQYRIETATGEPRHIEATGRRVTWNDQPAILVIVHDVTERVTREDQLTALHEATRAFVQATTPEEVAEQAVAVARDILGYGYSSIHRYDPEQDTLNLLAVTDELHEKIDIIPDIGPGDGIAGRVFAAGHSELIEDTHDDPDVLNPETELRTELYVPLGDDGLFIACTPEVAGIDESERQLLELLAANTEVALKQVAYREQLEEREITLEEQNARLDKFASVVSHDLRSPLNVAEGYLSLAREDGDPEAFDRVEQAHDRMDRIIGDLLYLAREDRQIGSTSTISLDDAVADAWEVVEAVDEDATLVTTGELGSIDADADRLGQLLENLFRNAIEHTGSDVTVRVEQLADGDGFAIEDDGPGISPSERDEVFDWGYSGDGGSGIGLYTVKQVVDGHGWTIDVTESDTGGARFEIRTGGTIE